MNESLAARVARAAAANPQGNGGVEHVEGRLLLVDGDGLCYYCAGNDETAPGTARKNLIDKLRAAQRACGADTIKIVVTSRGSHKGFRYAVARVKPYQGQRTSDRRPKNWAYLRELLELGGLEPDIDIEFTDIAEADDLFSRYALSHPDCVIYTQDKDMRMIPGKHLDWLTHLLFVLSPDRWRDTAFDKLWGRAWFWSQMLHGDQADNIPGLPFYKDGSCYADRKRAHIEKEIPCGEKSTAVTKVLANLGSDAQCILHLGHLYESCYGPRWVVEMLEQGILLWMRNDQQSSPLNVVAPGNPLHGLTKHERWPAARAEIMQRIAEAMIHEETQDNGSGDDAIIVAGGAGEPVCHLQAEVQEPGARPRPLDGVDPSGAVCGVQLPAGQAGEQPPAVRRAVPAGVLPWSSFLLAAPRN